MSHQTIHHHSLFRRATLALGLLLSLLLLQPDGPAQAGNFDLSGACGDVAALRQAITSANAAGGSNTIILAEDCEYQFSNVDNYEDGPNVLPSITGNITIEGNGSKLSASTAGRHFHIAGSGNLTLKNLELYAGFVQGGTAGGAGFGGSVYNRGTLQVIGTTFWSNRAYGGGGSYSNNMVGGGGGVFGTGSPNSPWGGSVGGAGGGGGGSAGHAQDIGQVTDTISGVPYDPNKLGGSNGGLPARDSVSHAGDGEDSSLVCIEPQTSVNWCRGGQGGQNLTGGGGGGRGGEGSSGGDGGDGGDGGNGLPGGGGGAGGAGGLGGSHVSPDPPFIAFAGDGGNGGDGGFGGGGGSGGDGNRAGCFVDTKGTSDPADDQLVCGLDGRGGDGGDGGFGGGGGPGGWGFAGHGTGGQGGFGGGDGGSPPGPPGGGGGAGMGGAIFNHAGTLLIANSTFGNNQINAGGGATGGSALGGAIFNYRGQVTLTNSTLAFNEVHGGGFTVAGDGTPGVPGDETGGAIYNYQGSLTLKNSILARSNKQPGNLPSDALDCVNNGGTVIAPAGSKNLIEKNGGCGTPVLTGDPGLEHLAPWENGGPTPTFALLANSPARNAGNNAICAAAPVHNLDQRGYFRVDTTCDIGAFEFGGDQDSDGDALPDSWETNGYDHNRDGVIDLNLPAMGANPQRKDIFVEIDYMESLTITHRPRPEAMNRVIDAFADAPLANPDGSRGITLHLDYGPDTVMNPDTGNTWGALSRSDVLSLTESLHPLGSSWNWSSFDAIKRLNPTRARIFHYAIAVHNLGADRPNVIGKSRNDVSTHEAFQQGASDLVIALGSYSEIRSTGMYVTMEASTLMHELGHNLGLFHGGDTSSPNHEPNHLSIMNYSFGNGLLKNGTTGLLDYSRFGAIPELNENDLDETKGLNGGSAISNYGTYYYCPDRSIRTINNANSPINWDCQGSSDETSVQANINDDFQLDSTGEPIEDEPIFSTLGSIEEWSRLVYDGGAIGFGASPTGLASQDVDPTLDDEPTIDELLAIPLPHLVTLNTGPYTRALAPNVATTIPFTVANRGTQAVTVLISTAYPNGRGWFQVSALPNSLSLAPGASRVINLPVNIPASAGATAVDNLTLIATPQESPLMGDSRRIRVSAGGTGGAGKVYLPFIIKGKK